jgi:hypothetical protein
VHRSLGVVHAPAPAPTTRTLERAPPGAGADPITNQHEEMTMSDSQPFDDRHEPRPAPAEPKPTTGSDASDNRS